MKDLLLLWAMWLPVGYFVVARYYPERRLPWRELIGMALAIAIWQLVAIIAYFKSKD